MLYILPLTSVYTAETLMYVKKNINCYTTNLKSTHIIQGERTTYTPVLILPASTVKVLSITGLQIYNTLPAYL